MCKAKTVLFVKISKRQVKRRIRDKKEERERERSKAEKKKDETTTTPFG